HGFGNESFGSKVHHGVDFMLGEDGFELQAVSEVHRAEDRARRHGRTVPLDQAVQGNDFDAASPQDFGTDTADVAGRSADQKIHVGVLLEPCFLPSRKIRKDDTATKFASKYWTPKTSQIRQTLNLRKTALEGEKDQVGSAAHAELIEQIGNVKF